jgi:Arc/MetJ family transcription regulator
VTGFASGFGVEKAWIIHIERKMRTNIEIDDALMTEALELTGLPSKKAVVDAALKRLVESHKQRQAIKNMRGLGWEGDLDEIRSNRF